MKRGMIVFLVVFFLIWIIGKLEKPKDQKPDENVEYGNKIEDHKAYNTAKYVNEIKDQKLKKALKYVNEIIDSSGSTFQKMGELGKLYDSTSSIYRKKIETNPTDIWARLSFAYSLQKQHQYDKALFHYLTALIQSPETADPLIGLGRLFYTLAVFDMGNRKLTSQTESGLPRFHPDDKIKDILIAAKNLLLTAKKKKRLVRNGPKNITLYISSPGTEDRFLEMIDDKLIDYWQKGTGMEKKHKFEAALKCYNEALLIEPNSFPILFNKGSVLFKLNRFHDAIKSFDKALDVRKFLDDAIIYREIARIHANGYQWPNDPGLISFLEKDVKNSKYKIRIGAVLLLNILSKNNSTASAKLNGILKNNPKILDEIKKLEFRKTKN